MSKRTVDSRPALGTTMTCRGPKIEETSLTLRSLFFVLRMLIKKLLSVLFSVVRKNSKVSVGYSATLIDIAKILKIQATLFWIPFSRKIMTKSVPLVLRACLLIHEHKREPTLLISLQHPKSLHL